jgi:hypothetical protein
MVKHICFVRSFLFFVIFTIEGSFSASFKASGEWVSGKSYFLATISATVWVFLTFPRSFIILPFASTFGSGYLKISTTT